MTSLGTANLKTVRIGIVGCGLIARFHALAIRETAGAELVACSSHSPESAKKFAAEWGLDFFPDVESLIASESVEALAVCTPSGWHLEPALLAAAAGLHLIVEKPLEVTPERCQQLIDAAAEHRVCLASVLQSRFSPVWQVLRAAVQQGEFGKLAVADASVKWFRPQSYYDSAAWRGTWQLDGGGALINQSIHTVDLMQWILGPVRRVGAFMATRCHDRIEVEDVAVASLEFASGVLGTLSVTTASSPGLDRRIEVHGDEGSAVLEDDRVVHWSGKNGDRLRPEAVQFNPAVAAGSGASSPGAIKHALHALQYADFVAAIRENRPPLVDGHEGKKSVELIATIYRSAREGRILDVD